MSMREYGPAMFWVHLTLMQVGLIGGYLLGKNFTSSVLYAMLGAVFMTFVCLLIWP